MNLSITLKIFLLFFGKFEPRDSYKNNFYKKTLYILSVFRTLVVKGIKEMFKSSGRGRKIRKYIHVFFRNIFSCQIFDGFSFLYQDCVYMEGEISRVAGYFEK